MDPERFYESNIRHIDEVVKIVCWRHNITSEDVQDFSQHVHLMLIENNYRRIRAYRGDVNDHALFKGYLRTVIARISLDRLRNKLGKWHPSPEAIKLGKIAEHLEKLVNRNKYSIEEAYHKLPNSLRILISLDDAHTLYDKLPIRQSRPQEVDDPEEPVNRESDPKPNPEELVKKKQIIELICLMLQSLTPDDRLLLKMHFYDDLKISVIARQLSKDNQQLYRRMNVILQKFREKLLQSGFKESDVRDLMEVLGEHYECEK